MAEKETFITKSGALSSERDLDIFSWRLECMSVQCTFEVERHARRIVALRVSELGFMAYVGENFPTRIGISDSFEFVGTFGCF